MKNNKSFTAVEWLDEIASKGFITPENFEQAKEMEKANAESIWKASSENMHRQFSSSAYKPITFEQFYNENYEI